MSLANHAAQVVVTDCVPWVIFHMFFELLNVNFLQGCKHPTLRGRKIGLQCYGNKPKISGEQPSGSCNQREGLIYHEILQRCVSGNLWEEILEQDTVGPD